MTEILPRIVGASMIATSVGIAIQQMRTLRTARRAERWPQTTGEIVSSEVRALAGQPKKHTCEIHYRYDAAGQQRESKTVSFFGIWTQREATAFVERFPAGGRATVYVDPDDPSRTVLVPGIHGKNRTHGFAMALIVGIAGVGVLMAAG